MNALLVRRRGRDFEIRFPGDSETKFVFRQRISQVDLVLEQVVPDVVIDIDGYNR
jgi:hypothetical protein